MKLPPNTASSRRRSAALRGAADAHRCALEMRPGKWGWSIRAAAGGAARRVERRPSAGAAVKGQRGQAQRSRRRVACSGPWSAGGGCEGSRGLRAPRRWSARQSRRRVAWRASVALAGATGGGQIGSGCQRGGGAERAARSRGGAAAGRPSAGVAVKGRRGQARRQVACSGPWSAGGDCEGSCGLRAPGRWSARRSRRRAAWRASVAGAGATGGGQIGSVRQRGGGAERVARSRGGAAAARAAWVGCGFHPFRRAAQHAAGADRAIALACGGGRACG